MNDIKFGALCWNQYTDWPSLLQAGIRADELGYDTLWTLVQRLLSLSHAGQRARRSSIPMELEHLF